MGNGKMGGGVQREVGIAQMNIMETPVLLCLSDVWVYGSYFASAHTSFLTNALKIIEIENPF